MKKELFTKMVLITPEAAKELLKLNVANRPLNQKTVDWYSKQMSTGQWTISGQTISISDKNTLIDGQHRLAAVVKSDCKVMFNIAYNVPIDSYINYDNLRTRTFSDALEVSEKPNSKRISAIISKYMAMKNGQLSIMGFGSISTSRGSGIDKSCSYKLTNKEMLDFYTKNESILQEISNLSGNFTSKIQLFTHSQISSIMLFLIKDLKHDNQKVFSFFKQLFFNENVENKSIYNLREKLISGSIGNYHIVPKYKYVFLVKCWNAYILGREINRYTFAENETVPYFL